MNDAPPPILEFDPDPNAILAPESPKLSCPVPRGCVLCFFKEVLDNLAGKGTLEVVGALGSEMGSIPLYRVQHEGFHLLVYHPGVGAALAGGLMDEVIAAGIHNFIACGGCGALTKEIDAGHAVILTAAVRDEGASYHYLPPGREVAANPQATRALEQVLSRQGVPFRLAKTWTTDGFYRETPARRARRLDDGCEVVEMEAAAFFAVAQFRGARVGQVVYGGDLVVPEGWDLRAWRERTDMRELLFWLAVEACIELCREE